MKRAADFTGPDLIARGCRQGALLLAPARMVWLRGGTPANANSANWEIGEESIPDTQLVIASQDCDIAAPVKTEPFVEALPARWTTNPSEIHTARKRNSARLYPLAVEKEKIFVADARRKVQIEKGALKEAAFAVLLPDERERTRFGLWVAGRYSRPAIEDEIVEALHKPLVRALEKLIGTTGEVQAILDRVDELLFRTSGQRPWTTDFVAMLEDGDELGPEEEASLSGWLEDTLVVPSGAIEQIRVLFRTARSISLHDYASMTRLLLDQFSPDGQPDAA